MKLSLCMIVKNEELYLKDCLESVFSFVDEIILVDTGSTDRTVEIAKKYTQSIYHFEWCDDFSKARNFALDKTNNDWVLILDADEVIKSFDIDSVNQFIARNESTIGRLKILNNYIDGDEKRCYVDRLSRLFNKKYYQYDGAIHEQVVPTGAHKELYEQVDITIEHKGYMDDVVLAKNKIERNIQLLKNEYDKHSQDMYIVYQIGKSYQMHGNYQEAIYWFEKALEETPDIALVYVQDLIESFGYVLLKCERYADALSLKAYEDVYKHSADFMFMMGSVYMNNAHFDEAINAYKRSTQLTRAKVVGVNTFLAHYNLGVIYEVLGNYYDAYIEYSEAGAYAKAINRKNKLAEEIVLGIQNTIEIGQIEDAKTLIKNYIPILDISIMHMLLGIACMLENRLDEAEKALKQAIVLDENNVDARYNLGFLYSQAGSLGRAKKVYVDLLNLEIDPDFEKDIRMQLVELEKH